MNDENGQVRSGLAECGCHAWFRIQTDVLGRQTLMMGDQPLKEQTNDLTM
jgi:hypothetical protein